MTAPVPDVDAARRFLARFDPEADGFTLQTFDDTEMARRDLARVRPNVKLANGALDALARTNDDGAGIFFG